MAARNVLLFKACLSVSIAGCTILGALLPGELGERLGSMGHAYVTFAGVGVLLALALVGELATANDSLGARAPPLPGFALAASFLVQLVLLHGPHPRAPALAPADPAPESAAGERTPLADAADGDEDDEDDDEEAGEALEAPGAVPGAGPAPTGPAVSRSHHPVPRRRLAHAALAPPHQPTAAAVALVAAATAELLLEGLRLGSHRQHHYLALACVVLDKTLMAAAVSSALSWEETPDGAAAAALLCMALACPVGVALGAAAGWDGVGVGGGVVAAVVGGCFLHHAAVVQAPAVLRALGEAAGHGKAAGGAAFRWGALACVGVGWGAAATAVWAQRFEQ